MPDRPIMSHLKHTCEERGFTLVELMVSITIGLLIALVVTQAYVNGAATQRNQSDITRLQESSRFAFDTLSHAVRKAGYKNPQAPGDGFCGTSEARLVGTNDAATFTDPSGTTFTILNSSDILRVRYYGEGLLSSPFTADGSMLDCRGNSIPANTITPVEDIYFVATSNDPFDNNEPALFCYTSNTPGTSVPITPGIESLQVLYGDDSNADDTINRYVPAGSVSTMNNVRSVMLSVVVRTPTAVATDRSSTRIFNHFGEGYAPGNAAPAGDSGSVFSPTADGRIRQQSSTTVALRNLCISH